MTITRIKSPNYNSVFNNVTGFFARWGKTQDEDPLMSPFGPEICDMEISTICTQGCSFCYKSNTNKGKNMSLETFSNILSKMTEKIINITLDNGITKQYKPTDEVMLISGNKKQAKFLTIYDEIIE